MNAAGDIRRRPRHPWWAMVAIVLGALPAIAPRAMAAAPVDTTAVAPDSGATDAGTAAEVPVVRLATATEVEAALATAREMLRDGDYDRAIEALKPALATARGVVVQPDSTGFGFEAGPAVERADVERLRDVYLLLIKTYVFLGNDLKFKPQGREASNLNYQEAKRLIGECLDVHALRRTQADPVSDPPEMVAFFDELRRQMFGAFRVIDVDPTQAVVTLDGDTLRAPGDTSAFAADMNLPVGLHRVVVRARVSGYHEYVDHISISPDVTLERSYYLPKRRGWLWYATWGTGIGVAGGLIAALAGGGGNDGGTAVLTPLPEAPGPPGGP